MSRVAKMPIVLDKSVKVDITTDAVTLKGNKGQETFKFNNKVSLNIDGNTLHVVPKQEYDESDKHAGTVRAILSNLAHGVTHGFEKKLVLVGVGYKAQVQGKNLNLTLGYSHPITFVAPEGITIESPIPTEILIKGTNKQLIGEIAAKIRAFRSPDPYKGKGVRYAGEVIILKETKKK